MVEDKRYGFPTLKISQGRHSLIVKLQIEHLKLPLGSTWQVGWLALAYGTDIATLNRGAF